MHLKGSTADGLPVCLSCINLKPAKTADLSVSDLHLWLVRVFFPPVLWVASVLSQSLQPPHSNVVGLEQLLAGRCVPPEVDVAQLVRGEIPCCHSVVLRPSVWSRPLVVLQDSLHL